MGERISPNKHIFKNPVTNSYTRIIRPAESDKVISGNTAEKGVLTKVESSLSDPCLTLSDRSPTPEFTVDMRNKTGMILIQSISSKNHSVKCFAMKCKRKVLEVLLDK